MFTHVYTGEVEERYEFDLNSYDRLAAAAVPWPEVLFVLYTSEPKLRRLNGDWLTVVARARSGEWLLVAAQESRDHDDVYHVTGARYLDPEESGKIDRLLGGST
jgi:hypothetical protein